MNAIKSALTSQVKLRECIREKAKKKGKGECQLTKKEPQPPLVDANLSPFPLLNMISLQPPHKSRNEAAHTTDIYP